jgi:signal transduction histidine kinase
MIMEEKLAKILLIEDEYLVRESYMEMLRFLNYDVETADNGVEGVKKVKNGDFDIVITDLNMPIMDGMETLRQIKKDKPEVEVIVVTGFATIENAISAMKSGAFDYITKPVSLEHVRLVLNRCVQQIHSKRENQELRDINTRLRELNELKNKFITITNHELRTPLAVIKGYIDLLDISIEREEGSEIGEYFAILDSTVKEMVEMVDSMHDLSRTKKKIDDSNGIDINVNELVEAVYKSMIVLFNERGISISIELEPNPIFIKGDRKLIRQSIRELMQNSLKFTKKGGEVQVSVSKDSGKNTAVIKVKDTGVGIPADKINLIFEKFYEVQDVMYHSTSKTNFMGGGIGVGLSMVKEIAENNNGRVVVESEVGKGSTFSLIFPLNSPK